MKANVNIYYIIVNSNQTFMPVSQKKKIVKVDALLLTHAVYGRKWKYVNRLRTGKGRCMVFFHEWGHPNDNLRSGTHFHTMQHLLQYPLLEQVCTAEQGGKYQVN